MAKKISGKSKALIIAGVVVLGVIGVGYNIVSSIDPMDLLPKSRDVYETVPPEFPEFTRPAVLVLHKANGFVHTDAIPAADAMLRRIAEQQGWDIFITDNAASHNTHDLSRFILVVWNNTSGDILTESQRADFKAWIENGGGWIGIHNAGGDFSYEWDWYVESLIGTQFIGHTMREQFRDADVLAADPELSITDHIPSVWRVAQEEWYAFESNPREKGHEVLLVIDESSYMDESEGRTELGLKGGVFYMPFHMEGEHPLVWRHQMQKGRALYSSIGHQPATYSLPEYQELIRKAMLWVKSKPSVE